jgi:hypothetical protein
MLTSKNFKDLNRQVEAKDIDFRVQSINKGGYATVLAYKDARYDMNVLDDVVGPENWQKDYKIIDGNLYCGIGVYTEKGWVWKWDVGTESNTEKEKGQASDAQKRAGFAWGIGRELYDFPVIAVKLNAGEFEDRSGKMVATYKLNIRKWNWEVFHEATGIHVRVSDENGEVRFDSRGTSRTSTVSKSPSAPKAPVAATAPADASQVNTVKPDDIFQKAIDHMKANKSQASYDQVIEKYGSKFSEPQKKALSKFIKA